MTGFFTPRLYVVSAVVTAAVLALPAGVQAALPDRTALTFDCSLGEDAEGDDEDHGIAPGETLIVTFINCHTGDGYELIDDSGKGNAETVVGSVGLTSTPITVTTTPFQVRITGVAEISIAPVGALEDSIDLSVFVGFDADDPAGSLLQTSTVTFTSPLAELEIPDTPVNPDDEDEVLLGGIPNCDVEPGLHIYREIEITITKSGTYTFRKIWVDPISKDLFWGVASPELGDSFLALYQGFDPSDPMDNIVACNDDVDELAIWEGAGDFEDESGGADDAIITTSGFLIDDQFPWLTENLEPGTYSLIIMGYGETPASEWSGTETIAYEFWGPEDGIGSGSTRPSISITDGYLDHLRARDEVTALPDTL